MGENSRAQTENRRTTYIGKNDEGMDVYRVEVDGNHCDVNVESISDLIKKLDDKK